MRRRISLKDVHGCSISGSKKDGLRNLDEEYQNEMEEQKQHFQGKTVLELDKKKHSSHPIKQVRRTLI